MLKKALGKLKSVTRKNLNRFSARKAIKNGMFKSIDRQGMLVLREKYKGHIYDKYENKFEHSLVRNAERVFNLDLDQAKNLKIFDIGCGFGYFLVGARHFGHSVVGLDIPDDYFKAITDLFKIPKVIHTIKAFEPLPEIPGGPFDRVTAFATMFDNAGHPGQWGRKEWVWFLKDLRRFMAPNCELVLKFNQYKGEGAKSGIGCKTVTGDVYQLFLDLGGVFDKRYCRTADAPSKIDKLPTP